MNKLLLVGETCVNCYFLVDKGSCFIVDPGCEKAKIQEYVEKNNLNVVGILLTHAHMDHICALDVYPVPIYLHRKEFEILEDTYRDGHLRCRDQVPFDMEKLKIILIRDKDTFRINDKTITAIHTPGHTAGGVCYRFGDELYTGDTLFKGRVGRWDLPTGDLITLRKSVVSIIDGHEDHIRIYPSRGESSTIGFERLNNSLYNEWKSMVS